MNGVENHNTIHRHLLKWYDVNKRNMPWRTNVSPYHVWLSEIILQQTRYEQGLPYYLTFTERFPNILQFANADQHEILKLWQGLGYYSRARNMHEAAKVIVQKHSGQFPQSYDELRKLKGIGPYTAAAIASICFNKAHAVVDGNVLRVLSRLYNDHTAVNDTFGLKHFTMLANAMLNSRSPGLHNQAMMELGALICKPQQPLCKECPLIGQCVAYEKKTVTALPKKHAKVKSSQWHFHYFVLQHQHSIYLNHRTSKNIWQGLYDFPCIEYKSSAGSIEESLKKIEKFFNLSKIKILNVSNPYKHVLTHKNISATFIYCSLSKAISTNKEKVVKVKMHDLHTYAVPRLIEKYMETIK